MKLYAFAAIAALSLSACATKPYVPTLYDASSYKVETIAIADDAIGEKLGANELASAMGTGQAAGGLIGVLVVAAMEGAETSSRVGSLNKIMETSSFDAEASFEKMLSEKLLAAGYNDVKIVGGERKNRGPLKEFPETTADAILDVSMTNFGMQKAQTGQEWRPAAGVNVKLVSSVDDSVLMENMISYNSGVTQPSTEGMIILSPSVESVGYMKIKEMDAVVVEKEMMTMLDEITTTIVSLLG